MPPGILYLLQLFSDNNLSYLLFKCDHIFAGENKNVDLLFETDADYQKAAALLAGQGFAVRLSEKVEKYKTMYCGFVNVNRERSFHSIHLHREIAWHGMIALCKVEVFARKKTLAPLIIVPGLEDSILIHAAHVLFENFRFINKEQVYFSKITYGNDRYMQVQAKRHHWISGFKRVAKMQLTLMIIAKTWIEKLSREPQIALYILQKIIKRVARTLSPKRKGILIALVGVNGAGKTTLAKKTLEHYGPFLEHLKYFGGYYYFGWKPDFVLTKIASHVLKINNNSIFSITALRYSPVENKFSLFQEFLFLMIFFEFYYRYLVHVRPRLQKKGLLISDRYFYDIYGQYPYAPKSRSMKILLRLFPKPDYTFLLSTTLENLYSRSKEDRTTPGQLSIPRKKLPQDYLAQQMANYSLLAKKIPVTVINTEMDSALCADQIVSRTWRKISIP